MPPASHIADSMVNGPRPRISSIFGRIRCWATRVGYHSERAETGFLDRGRCFVRFRTLVDAIPGRLTIVCCSNTVRNLICARSTLPCRSGLFRGCHKSGAVWKTQPDGQSSAQVLGLKLVVRKYDNCARYVVLQPGGYGGTCAQDMLSSGTEPNPNAAMVAAEKAATRTVYMFSERRR